MLVCPEWAWVFLYRAKAASTNLSQRAPALLHITQEHKPGRKGSLFSCPPRWAEAGNSLHPKPLPFLLLHTLNDASEAGWQGSNRHPVDRKRAIFSTQQKQRLAECKLWLLELFSTPNWCQWRSKLTGGALVDQKACVSPASHKN